MHNIKIEQRTQAGPATAVITNLSFMLHDFTQAMHNFTEK